MSEERFRYYLFYLISATSSTTQLIIIKVFYYIQVDSPACSVIEKNSSIWDIIQRKEDASDSKEDHASDTEINTEIKAQISEFTISKKMKFNCVSSKYI